MDLEIQTRHIDLDPAWRDLIEHSARRLAERYPEMLRMHVTLRHGLHHRTGSEEVSLVANVEGTTLYARKEEERTPAALHAAFHALAIELERHHRERRRVNKRPGPRMRGSIKRLFREGGYGFIHYEPGRDVYFCRASLHEMNFEDLEPGLPVDFDLEEGEAGLQAASVYPAGERARL